MKKILLLADANSNHIKKWGSTLSSAGFKVSIFTLAENLNSGFWKQTNVEIYSFPHKQNNKLLYITALPKLKKVIKTVSPDILHAHYASSYGLLGALSSFHPFIISVWGSDIYEFPKQGILQNRIIKYNLSKANAIFSTSKSMADEAKKYTQTSIYITPFGIDCTIFKKSMGKEFFEKSTLVIGTIKSLEKVYGIDTLIRAFNIVHKKYSSTRLLICGSGSKEMEYKSLVKILGIDTVTLFTGKIPTDETPMYHNSIDIFVNISLTESFGVSVLESSACEKPVVAGRVGGLIETVKDQVTGIMVPPGNVEETVSAIIKLIENPGLAQKLGTNGREFVLKNYDWKENSKHIIDLYNKILS
jgi:L-malate glycosyltransferase